MMGYAFLKTVWLKVFLGNKSLFKHGLTSRASPIHILFNISIPASYLLPCLIPIVVGDQSLPTLLLRTPTSWGCLYFSLFWWLPPFALSVCYWHFLPYWCNNARQAVCVTTHKGSWVKLLLRLISIVTRSSSHFVREMNQTQGSKHCCLFLKTLRKREISRIFKIL